MRFPRLGAAALAVVLATAALYAQAPGKIGEEITNSAGMKMRLVPAGNITLRWTEEDILIVPVGSEEVEIPSPFYIGSHEVTQAQYDKVMGTNPSAFRKGGDCGYRVRDMKTTGNLPVENVLWEEAREFCKKLSDMPEERKAGRKYRLPTGNEWEYCARCGKSGTNLFITGEGLSSKDANFNGLIPGGNAPKGEAKKRTTVVGEYKANAWGLYDMHGNVWEWCENEFMGKEGKTPTGLRMLRGGSWVNRGRDCACTTRLALDPKLRFANIGFRVVCDVEKK